jgi:hypothetical protein
MLVASNPPFNGDDDLREAKGAALLAPMDWEYRPASGQTE